MKLHFIEKQYFKSTWILVLLTFINCLFIYGIIQQVIFGNLWGNNPLSNSGLIILEGTIFGFSIWFLNIKFIVKVCDEGIYFTFRLLWFKYKVIQFNQIEYCKTREYNAFKEFGGWGIQGTKSNKAYTISGKNGVQIGLKNGNKVLIGSQKPKSLTKAIEKILANS
jgi:hypothetical protein